ncbi:MAG: hypothetical protein COU65_03025 [Candidatus Pacebacteria bacterium CG10_big_fil_rev_8_21_14_0_10_42_12]|nr:hypothetical protein [Candidatus Paceibacterota bacterium]PIR62517.1 MAG: hypothetical protein COU65_03025 [Candidatus Pacebacteria bacterium CG10_big_fil_rev_8_21_14_0_10_42_12]
MKILISGGHLTPALAFIDFVKTQKNVEMVFVGRIYSQERSKQRSHESEEVLKRDIKFIPFRSGKLLPSFSIFALKELGMLIKGFFHACLIIRSEKPSLVMTFGGYLAVPLAISAWLHRIPVVLHEQTSVVGISNSLIGKIATLVAVSYPHVEKSFAGRDVVVTGNLLRNQLLDDKVKRPAWLSATSTKPILYITGGNQGSEVINTTVLQLLPQITRDWLVVHQCGTVSEQSDYQKILKDESRKLSVAARERYAVREWINEKELAWIYQNCTAAISRSGANTTYEFLFFAIPSILIPLPFSPRQEQQKNAEFLAKMGGAVLLTQKELSAQSLRAALSDLQKNVRRYKNKLRKNTPEAGGAKRLWQALLKRGLV